MDGRFWIGGRARVFNRLASVHLGPHSRRGMRRVGMPVAVRVRSRVPRRALCVWACSLAFVATSPALAQPPAAERAAAESLFQDGRRLLEAGETSRACLKFSESQRLAPALGSLLNLAACHELEGKTASAWVEFTEASTLAERAGEMARAAYAAERARKLAAELAYITLAVSVHHDGLRVTLDGRVVGVGALDTPLPVDPGEHRIRAAAPGLREWEHSVVVGRGPSQSTIPIPELVPERVRPNASERRERAQRASAAATASRLRRAPPPAEPASASRRPWLIAAGTVAVAGAGVGTWFGLRTFAEKKVSDRECPQPRCSSRAGVEANERAHDAALASTLAFGAGALGAGVFTYLLLDGARGEARRSGFRLAPVLAGGAHVLAGTEF